MIETAERPWTELVRCDRKTLGITVRCDRSVIIRAPLDAPEERILERVRRRHRWIAVQKAYFAAFIPRTSDRRYISGEGHLYLGRRYRLKVITGERPGVRLWAGYIEVRVGKPGDSAEVQRRLWDWYRRQARRVFAQAFEKVQARWPVALGFSGYAIRRMAKRWGSCTRAGLITLNLDLIRAPKICIEYVILHELCHLREPNHSRSFFRALEGAMPDWRSQKELLERLLV